MKEKANVLFHKIYKPIIGGNDSHYFIQVGSIKVVHDK